MAGTPEHLSGQRAARAGPRLAALRLVCAGANVAEAAVALAFGIGGGLALAPQAAAPAPLGLFSDLRWLLVYERSWLSFALGLGLVLVFRTGLTALQIRLAWPTAPPALGRLFARLGAFHLVLAVVLMPFVLLLFGFAAFPVSWLYFAAVPSAIVCSALVADGALAPGWWRHPPRIGTLGLMLVAVVVLTAAAGLVGAAPDLAAIPVAAAAGLAEAALWRRLAAVAAGRPTGRFAPVAPALLVTFLVGALGGAWASFSAARPPHHGVAALDAPARAGRRAVLVVGGFSSTSFGDTWHVATLPAGAYLVSFSYSGSRPDGSPLPYGAAATHAAIPALARLMARQVDALAHRTGEKVDIVAVSEGSAVASAFLDRHPHAPVGAAVLVSPLIHAGNVRYPAVGRDGWGMVAGRGLSLLGAWLSPMAAQDLSPNQPFLRSLAAGTPARVPASSVRRIEVVPLADAVAGPPNAVRGTTVVVVPGFHGANLDDPTVQAVIGAAVRGRSIRTDRTDAVLARAIASLAAAWRVPNLTLTS